MSDIGIDELAARLGEVPILDVRRPEEYDGSFGSPCDPRQGHIPGAVNLSVDELMILSETEARERVGLPEGAEVVAYCHSGSRSALAVQILGRSATLPATTPARGTSGREPSCRSTPEASRPARPRPRAAA